MQQSKTILFFGNERLATGVVTKLPVLNGLVLEGYHVAAIVLPGKHTKPGRLEVLDFAAKHHIPILYLASTSLQELASYHAPLAVLASFGSLVRQAIIDLFPRGIVNIHPSLLPKHRGPIPIESVILHNEPSTGVSLMRLSAKMDSGPLYGQTYLALKGHETKQALADSLDQLGADLLLHELPDILSGKLKPKAQPLTGSSYDQRLNSQSGLLDFTLPAKVLERQVRAYAGWPKSRFSIQHIQLIITAAHVIPKHPTYPGQISSDKQQLCIDTLQDTLCIDRLIPAGSKEMSGAEFIRGYGKLLT